MLDPLKLYGKECQRVQQHVASRSSTQARSHAQKFFCKLEKRALTLEEFLAGLDISKLKQQLCNSDTLNSTNYNEDEAVLAVLDRKKARTPNALKTVSVLNAAIPVGGSGEPRNPSQESQRVSKKRLRKDVSEYHSAEEADEKIDTSPTRKSKLS